MRFTESPLAGAFVIDMDRIADERGFFGRSFCVDEFQAHGLPADVNQCSVSFNARRGTLRGMHFQLEPHAEAKLVRCTAGAIFDVIVDIRAASPTLHRWFGVDLTAQNRRSLFIPPGFAHGFVTLVDESEVHYMISMPYVAEAGRGLRWDDPAIDISWPITPLVISARDAAYPLLAGRPT